MQIANNVYKNKFQGAEFCSSFKINLTCSWNGSSQNQWSVPASAQGPAGAAGAAGPPPAANVSSNKRLQQTQAQVDEVVDIMRMNVDKVLERDQKLSELDNRADALQAGASQFETSAAKLKRKYWWKNCKMMIILGVVCAVILIIIINSAVLSKEL
ncbi:LOW QUALITY PROTEIN: vesicle-associated membrane protein 2-like [Ammospiza caudacuta]|uniref:LOW QUALITY PROTEIN: vesicle-associated membrane protein 2-like n=1 Tax=Ammospiza caudacuta TaxID=2857398 RepID=UPI00273A11DA|nr:LOW QUALITY PROTEIN: vesicle-associated membrane protein 2-like [Ammospiza caudacuta]